MKPYEKFRELIRNLERKMGILDESQVACCNITLAQCHTLVEIGRAKTLSLIQLSKILELEKSTVSRTVEHLVKAQLVSRNTDLSNRRYITISLTENGQKAFHEIETAMNSQFARILRAIPEEKQALVMNSIQILIHAIQSSETNNERE
jgi:DNA-binding MarR family transcriptional regulator